MEIKRQLTGLWEIHIFVRRITVACFQAGEPGRSPWGRMEQSLTDINDLGPRAHAENLKRCENQ